MECRIHRTGRATIDLDYWVSLTLTVTETFEDHQVAVTMKTAFDNLTPEEQLNYLKNLINEQQP